MYTKYIITCTIIYSLFSVLYFILFAGRLYFVDVTYCIKILANETGKFMSARSAVEEVFESVIIDAPLILKQILKIN